MAETEGQSEGGPPQKPQARVRGEPLGSWHGAGQENAPESPRAQSKSGRAKGHSTIPFFACSIPWGLVAHGLADLERPLSLDVRRQGYCERWGQTPPPPPVGAHWGRETRVPGQKGTPKVRGGGLGSPFPIRGGLTRGNPTGGGEGLHPLPPFGASCRSWLPACSRRATGLPPLPQ